MASGTAPVLSQGERCAFSSDESSSWRLALGPLGILALPVRNVVGLCHYLDPYVASDHGSPRTL